MSELFSSSDGGSLFFALLAAMDLKGTVSAIVPFYWGANFRTASDLLKIPQSAEEPRLPKKLTALTARLKDICNCLAVT